jgi:hypothetical protein
MPNNTTTKPEPPQQQAPIPKTAAEVASMLATLKSQLSAFESQQATISQAEFDLSASYTAGDPSAIKQMAELEKQAAVTQLHIKLTRGSIEQALALHEILVQREAEEAEVNRKRSYEKLLLLALEEAKHADAAIATYASHMKAREALLEEAQGLARHAHELGVLRQLRGQQGPSWQLGHFGVTRLLDPHAFGYTVGFQPLAAYSTAMLPNYGLNPPEEPAPTGTPATPPPPQENNKNANKSKRPN